MIKFDVVIVYPKSSMGYGEPDLDIKVVLNNLDIEAAKKCRDATLGKLWYLSGDGKVMIVLSEKQE
jgi:hypothetical protein